MDDKLIFIISFITSFVIFFLAGKLGIPLWAIIFLALPLLLVFYTAVSFIKNTSAGLKLKEVAEKPFKKRIDKTLKDMEILEPLGFILEEQKLLEVVPATLVFFFKHSETPVYLWIYDTGEKRSFEMITFFENEKILVTSKTTESGDLPPDPAVFLQIINNAGFTKIFELHKNAMDFLQKHGFKPVKLSTQKIREKFLNIQLETGKRIRKIKLWPFKIIYWPLARTGKKYTHTIEEQEEMGLIEIDKNG